MAEKKKDWRKSTAFSELKRDLESSLQARGLVEQVYRDKVNEYLDFWVLHQELKADIKARGLVVMDDRGRESENRSVSLSIQVSRQMLNIYTKFFETCWREEDGPKADAADITIRMMRKPETIEEMNHTGDPQPPTILPHGGSAAATPDQPKPDGITDEQWTEHLKTLAAIHEWTEVHNDEPFLDPLEQIDPRVREWRQILRRRYNFNKRYDKGTKDSTARRGD